MEEEIGHDNLPEALDPPVVTLDIPNLMDPAPGNTVTEEESQPRE